MCWRGLYAGCIVSIGGQLLPSAHVSAWTICMMPCFYRRPAPAGSSCIGVDLNRNWNVTGFGVGASTNPCSEVYRVRDNLYESLSYSIVNTVHNSPVIHILKQLQKLSKILLSQNGPNEVI